MTSCVPFIDLKAQYRLLRAEIMQAVQSVLDTQEFVLGHRVEAFERALASYCGVEHAVGVSSGTDALLIALMAEEVGPGDEVVTSPYTFVATAASIARLGALPVFVDIDPDTFNLDPERVDCAITPRTRALMPVHLFGQMADVEAIASIAETHELPVIEDAAQAIGAEMRGRKAGSHGDYGCFSFFPSKNLGGAGDGGMVVSGDARKISTLRALRTHGGARKDSYARIGGNFRLDALQAAILDVKLRHLDEWTERRRDIAARYRRWLTEAGVGVDGSVSTEPDSIVLPRETDGGRHVYNQFVVRCGNRDVLRRKLTEAGIATAVYYPRPLHLQACFQYLGYRAGQFPESERAARETLALPMYPELSEAAQARVVETIVAHCRSARTVGSSAC